MTKFLVKTVDGRVIGPLSAIELKQLAQTGGLTPACLVRKAGDGDVRWYTAAKVKGLDFGTAAATRSPGTRVTAPGHAGIEQAIPATSEAGEAEDTSTQPTIAATSSTPTTARAGRGWLLLVIGFAVLYFGGWRVIWGLPNYKATGHLWEDGNFAKSETPAALLKPDCVAIRVGENGYYGVGYVSRFFNSPVLSWGVGIVGGLIVLAAVGDGSETTASSGD